MVVGCIDDAPWSPFLVKFTPNGVIDTSFGVDGFSIVNVGDYVSVLWGDGFTELPDGRLVAPGCGPGRVTSAVIMFNADGSLDTSFGNNGFAEIDLQRDGAEFFHSLAIQPDGKIVAVGGTSTDPSRGVTAHHPGYFTERFSIARFNADGSLDKRHFAKPKGGLQLDLAEAGNRHFSSVKLLSDGRILAVGTGIPTVDGVHNNTYLARFQANGRLDSSFDEDGWVNLDVMTSNDGTGIVIVDDHHYVVGGNGWTPEHGGPILVLVSEE